MSDHTHGEYEISENQKRYYTPTTEEVRRVYAIDSYSDARNAMRGERFDRWLAEVKADAWEEGYAAGDADAHTKDRLDRYNPYINGETT